MDYKNESGSGDVGKAKEKHRGVFLTPCWRNSFDAIDAVCRLPDPGTAKGREAVAAYATALWKNAKSPVPTRQTYSRTKDWYAARPGFPFGYKTTIEAVELLVDAGWASDHVKQQRGQRGAQSSVRSAQWLAEVVLPRPKWEPYSLVRVRIAAGGYKEVGRSIRGEREVRLVKAFNEAIAGHEIDLEHSDVFVDTAMNTASFPPRVDEHGRVRAPHVVYTDQIGMHRVYCRDQMHGGRFYGPWWQNTPARYRKAIKLNGEQVHEEDYRQLHPRLLYESVGLALAAEEDVYHVDGFTRDEGKRALNIIINASTEQEAIGAIAMHMSGGTRPSGKTRARARRLLEAMKKRHAPISRYFHRGVGLRLQKVDSMMCADVLKAILLKDAKPCLPVHDSFIVEWSQRRRLKDEMREAYLRQATLLRRKGL